MAALEVHAFARGVVGDEHQQALVGLEPLDDLPLLRRKLRRDIRAVRAGDDIARPAGTEADPVRTYGGDTILRIPKRTDDEDGFLREIQHRVAKIYFAGSVYGGDERVEYIRRELAPLSEG